MLIILFRVLIVYVIVLFYLRLMGKRQVGEMQPFELVITLIMADIATLPMTQTSMPLLFSVIPLTMIVVVHFVVSFLSRKSITMRKIINGKPVVVVSPNGVEVLALKELNMTFDDLMQGLRAFGCYRLEDVAYAIVETNGTMSVILKTQSSPVTNKDLNLKTLPATIPLILISDGKMLSKNIKKAQIDKRFLDDVCVRAKLDSIKQIDILTLDSNRNVYVQPKQGRCVSFQTKCWEAKTW